jgi:hypothetical protein
VLDRFLVAYWNQMAPDIYDNFLDAIVDFRNTEGPEEFELLAQEIRQRLSEGAFPSEKTIDLAYGDPFWERYSMIITIEDVKSCNYMLKL